KDGRKIQTVRYSYSPATPTPSYTIVALDGRKVSVSGEEVVTKRDLQLPLDELPAQTADEIRANRAAAAANTEAAEAAEVDRRAVPGARTRVALSEGEHRRALADVETARRAQEKARQVTRDAPIDAAKAGARYDAAKVELAAASSCPNCLAGIPCPYGHR